MKSVFHKNRTILTLIIQTIILILTVVTAVIGILDEISTQGGDIMKGLEIYFQAFTMDSNVLAGICAFFIVFYAAGKLLHRVDATPVWVLCFQYIVTACLFLTIVTVVFFLAPMDAMSGKSYWDMFSNDFFVFHLINPLLAVFSFVFLQDEYRFELKNCIWVIPPIGIYIILYFLMVVVFRRWDDFYGFTLGGYYLIPVIIIGMLLAACLLSRILIGMNDLVRDKRAARSME